MNATAESLREYLRKVPRTIIVLEAQDGAAWIERVVCGLEHEALFVAPSTVALMRSVESMGDRPRAEQLARLGRLLLGVMRHPRSPS